MRNDHFVRSLARGQSGLQRPAPSLRRRVGPWAGAVFTLLLAGAVPGPHAAIAQQATPNEKFSPSAVRADFEYLYKTLQGTHYDLYVSTPKEVFDRAFVRTTRRINKPMTQMEVHRVFQPFVALSKLAHCSLGFPYGAYGQYRMDGGRVFPFELVILGRRTFVKENYSTVTAIVKGDEILAVDGVPMERRLRQIHEYLSGHDEAFKNSFIDVLAFPRVYWAVFDRKDVFSLRIKPKNGPVRTYRVGSVSASTFEEGLGRKRPVFNTSREFKFIGDVAYLRPGLFLNNDAKEINTSDHATFETGEFARFLDASFGALQERRARDLIIDLRGNPGGDNKFSDLMVAYFAKRPFWFCSQFLVRTSAITKAFWKDVDDPSLADLKKGILSKKDGERFEVTFGKYSPRTDSLRFEGRVLVLVDRYSYSNAPGTAALIQDYKFGTIVGEHTADSPTSYGAVHEFKLPNTRLAVTYPKALIVRPNGDRSVTGVVPDIEVHDDVWTDDDEILNAALEIVRRNAGTN
jgi:hypothetical protein